LSFFTGFFFSSTGFTSFSLLPAGFAFSAGFFGFALGLQVRRFLFCFDRFDLSFDYFFLIRKSLGRQSSINSPSVEAEISHMTQSAG